MKYMRLNPEQQRDYCMTMLLMEHAEKYMHNWVSPEQKEVLIKAAKLISTVVVDIAQSVSPDTARQLHKAIKGCSVFCLPKPEAQARIRESKRKSCVPVREEALLVLAEHSLQHCKAPCGRNHKECILRKVAKELKLPEFDTDTKGRKCEYEQR